MPCQGLPAYLKLCKTSMLIPQHKNQPLLLHQGTNARVRLERRCIARQHIQQRRRKAQRSMILLAPLQHPCRLVGIHHGVVKVGQGAEHGGRAGAGPVPGVGGLRAQSSRQLRFEVDSPWPMRAESETGEFLSSPISKGLNLITSTQVANTQYSAVTASSPSLDTQVKV